MKGSELTRAEFVLLGLVAETPRHGYAIEEALTGRGVRDWADIGTSSIYFVLSKLEARGLVQSVQLSGAKSRKTYSATADGMACLEAETLQALGEPVATSSNLLLGLANWPAADEGEAVEALRGRQAALAARIAEISARRESQRPLPDFVEAMFDYSLGQMRAEANWLMQFLKTREDTGMEKIDFRKTMKTLWHPTAKDFSIVEVPAMQFAMIDGKGDPNVSPDYAAAVQWLYGLSYTLKFMSKKELQRDYTVPPLEGLWWAEDLAVFTAGDRADWQWTMMIMQPDWITRAMFNTAIEKVKGKQGEPPASLRLETYDEGLSVQIMHIGPYSAEAPTIARLHDEFLPANGLTETGNHHEIYLSDPRRTAPEKLKTVLRQPVKRV